MLINFDNYRGKLQKLESIINEKKKLQKQSRNIGTFQREKRNSAHFWCNKPHNYIPENFEEYTDNFGYTEGDCQANKFFICSLPPVKELTSLPEVTVIEPASTSQKKSRGIRQILSRSLRSKFFSKTPAPNYKENLAALLANSSNNSETRA